MIKMTIHLKSGQQLNFNEINKALVQDNLLTVSTFRGQYACIGVDDIASFEIKYPQSKANKAYAIFKQILSQIKRGDE